MAGCSTIQPSTRLYRCPNNNRRRVPGYLYLLLGAACIAAWALAGSDAVLVNGGFLAAGVLLVLLGIYHLLAGWNLDVDERDALVAATRQVGCAVGHASWGGRGGVFVGGGAPRPSDLRRSDLR